MHTQTHIKKRMRRRRGIESSLQPYLWRLSRASGEVALKETEVCTVGAGGHCVRCCAFKMQSTIGMATRGRVDGQPGVW